MVVLVSGATPILLTLLLLVCTYIILQKRISTPHGVVHSEVINITKKPQDGSQHTTESLQSSQRHIIDHSPTLSPISTTDGKIQASRSQEDPSQPPCKILSNPGLSSILITSHTNHPVSTLYSSGMSTGVDQAFDHPINQNADVNNDQDETTVHGGNTLDHTEPSADDAEDADPVEYPPLEPGDYYMIDGGLMVFTRQYHLKRGVCCKNICRHCPYGFEGVQLKRIEEQARQEQHAKEKQQQQQQQQQQSSADGAPSTPVSNTIDIEDLDVVVAKHRPSQHDTSTTIHEATPSSISLTSSSHPPQPLPATPAVDEFSIYKRDSDPPYIDYARVKAKARAPPRMPADDECCGTGCVRCVFDIYDTNLEKWQKRRDNAVQEQIDEYNTQQADQ